MTARTKQAKRRNDGGLAARSKARAASNGKKQVLDLDLKERKVLGLKGSDARTRAKFQGL